MSAFSVFLFESREVYTELSKKRARLNERNDLTATGLRITLAQTLADDLTAHCELRYRNQRSYSLKADNRAME
jgi:hypothetical protein